MSYWTWLSKIPMFADGNLGLALALPRSKESPILQLLLIRLQKAMVPWLVLNVQFLHGHGSHWHPTGYGGLPENGSPNVTTWKLPGITKSSSMNWRRFLWVFSRQNGELHMSSGCETYPCWLMISSGLRSYPLSIGDYNHPIGESREKPSSRMD